RGIGGQVAAAGVSGPGGKGGHSGGSREDPLQPHRGRQAAGYHLSRHALPHGAPGHQLNRPLGGGMRAFARVTALAVIAVLIASSDGALAVTVRDLAGTWETARSPGGDRLYIRLQDKGQAEVVTEYDFQLPGQPTRRGRSTTMAKWSVKGDELTLSYAKV